MRSVFLDRSNRFTQHEPIAALFTLRLCAVAKPLSLLGDKDASLSAELPIEDGGVALFFFLGHHDCPHAPVEIVQDAAVFDVLHEGGELLGEPCVVVTVLLAGCVVVLEVFRGQQLHFATFREVALIELDT